MEIKDCRITDTHVFFWGSVFSNWYICEFEYKGHKFYNTEQAFMWEKAIYFNDKEIAELILATPNPKENKKLGRNVRGFDDQKWAMVSYIIMTAVNLEKYLQYPNLKKILLSTDNKMLVEASPYDKIWGIGLSKDDDDCLDETKWLGLNLLGKALMMVRKTIIENEKNN